MADNSKDVMAGLTTNSPPSSDASMKKSGGSVNDDATRKDTAKSPGTIGPRNA